MTDNNESRPSFENIREELESTRGEWAIFCSQSRTWIFGFKNKRTAQKRCAELNAYYINDDKTNQDYWVE